MIIKGWWWKFTGVVLLIYVFIVGMTGEVPDVPILRASIRNLYFHVPMWFSMMFIMLMSMIFSVLYLWKSESGSGAPTDSVDAILHKQRYDILASEWARMGFLLGMLGVITGAIWSKATWGAFFVQTEIKVLAASAGVLIYAAYFVLRGSLYEEDSRARIAAVYNIFAFFMFIVLINVLPRVMAGESLHPGNKQGSPGFNTYDLDNQMRLVFYPAVIGWTLLSGWIIDLLIRLKRIEKTKLLKQ